MNIRELYKKNYFILRLKLQKYKLYREIRTLIRQVFIKKTIINSVQLPTNYAPPKFLEIDINKANRQTDKIAVILHLYYEDVFEEISQQLSLVDFQYDLYISLVKGFSDHIKNQILEKYPKANIYIFENHGRDILPFYTFIRAGILDKYQFICKIHSKKSSHNSDGNIWRKLLYHGLFGSFENITRIVKTLEQNSKIGLIVPLKDLTFSHEYWGDNQKNCRYLTNKMQLNLMDKFPYPMGSMFWANTHALKTLELLDLKEDDFEPELGQLDGTMPHAIERMIGFFVQNRGYNIVSSHKLTCKD